MLWHGNKGSRKQTVFYLHGSLFFHQDDEYFIKQERGEDINLLSIVANSIISHKAMPLIVLEGNSRNKVSKICEHAYLNDAFDHLGKLSGDLFIFGHSLSSTDDHILNKIKEGGFEKIFISVFDENMKDEIISRAHDVFDRSNRDRRIFLYRASSANVWG